MENFYKLLPVDETSNGAESKKLNAILLEKIAAYEKKRADDLQKLQSKKNEEQKIMMDLKKEEKRITAIRQSLQDVKNECNCGISSFEKVKHNILNLPATNDLVTDNEAIDTCLASFKSFNQFLKSTTEHVAKKRSTYDRSNVFGAFLSEKDVLKCRLEENAKHFAKIKASRETVQTIRKESDDKSTFVESVEDEEKVLKVELASLEEEDSGCNDENAEKKAALVEIEFSEAKLGDDPDFDGELSRLQVLKESVNSTSEQYKLESENLADKLASLKKKWSETEKMPENVDLEITNSEEQLTNLTKKQRISELLEVKEKKIKEKKDDLLSRLRQVLETEENSQKVLREKSLSDNLEPLNVLETEVSKLSEMLEQRNYDKRQLENAIFNIESKFGALISLEKLKHKEKVAVTKKYASEKEQEDTVVFHESQLSSLREVEIVRKDNFVTPRKTAITQRGPSHVSIDPFEPIEAAPILTSTPLNLPARRKAAPKKATTAPKRGRGRPAKRGK